MFKQFARTLKFVATASLLQFTYLNCIEDKILLQAKQKIEQERLQMIKEWGTQITSYPDIAYGMRGNRYYIEFLVDQRKCDVFTLVINALQPLQKEEGHIKILEVSVNHVDQAYSMTVQFEENLGSVKGKLRSEGTLHLTGEMINDRPAFKFTIEKTQEISQKDIEAFINCYRDANKPRNTNFNRHSSSQTIQNQVKQQSQNSIGDAIQKLNEMGVNVFVPKAEKNLDWEYLAGYERQKRDIEDTVLLALQYPDIYDSITSLTRMKNEPNRPKAVLFEGPPGTGKTTSAKIIAEKVNIPLVYLPIESIMSKWYGESEKRFSEIWENCIKMGKVIIFLDEVDAIAQSRDGDMHEASRRILSTLLRKIDSFESTTNVLLICATNRKQDLDAAMLSRIDLSVKFELPDKLSRQAIFQRYAKQLSDDERKKLSELSEGMSGRNISDICKDAERRWASKLIRKEVEQKAPNLAQYIDTLKQRANSFI